MDASHWLVLAHLHLAVWGLGEQSYINHRAKVSLLGRDISFRICVYVQIYGKTNSYLIGLL